MPARARPRSRVSLSRRVTTTSHGSIGSSRASAASSSADASSIRCASSISMQRPAAQLARAGSAAPPRAAARARNSGASCVDLGASAARRRRARAPAAAATGTSAGSSAADARARSRSSADLVGCPPRPTPTPARSSSRQATYGVAAVYGLAGRRAAREVVGAVAQLLHQARLADPGLADDLDQPALRRARGVVERLRRAARSSRSRPTSGKRIGHAVARGAPADAPARRPAPGPGGALPLTLNGSSAVVSKRVGERSSTAARRVDRRPCGALAISRAARFTASPMTL